jgi:2,4-dienoyl-CoA reductase-like NADH-dependent reductase (Old Yellow Enzyme family)
MSADDFVPGGVTTTDTGPLAQALQAAGVDLIDVSAGTYESMQGWRRRAPLVSAAAPSASWNGLTG